MSRKSVASYSQNFTVPEQGSGGLVTSVLAKFKLDSLISTVARKSSFVQNKLIPGWSEGRVEKLLFAPKNRSKAIARAPKGFRDEIINTSAGGVHAYSTGSGPTVVFVHGWGGQAYQFLPLMRGLARCGFTAIAFDHIGHGQSQAKPTTLKQSIETANEVLRYIRKNSGAGFAALVGHSTGCLSIVNARQALIKDVPLFLISPVFNYRLYFLKRLVSLKLHPDMLKQYAARFGKIYRKEYESMELGRHLGKYADVAVIAHDESDSETSVTDSIKFCNQNPLTRLLVTKQFDHKLIINSESVWQELKSTLNYDDTTINFSDTIING